MVTLVALALIALLAYVILRPMLLPKTYFGFMCADEIRTLALPPMAYVMEDFNGYIQLENAFSKLRRNEPRLFFGNLASPTTVDDQLDFLRGSALRNRDVLILYIGSYGVVRGEKAYLVCNEFDPVKDNMALYSVADLLERLNEIPGVNKLVLLDATRNDYEPRLGMTLNGFADVLEKQVRELAKKDELNNVWVLSASSSAVGTDRPSRSQRLSDRRAACLTSAAEVGL